MNRAAAAQLDSASHPARRAAGGFTLLELILAMTMVAMLTLSLFAAMSTAFKAKNSADRAIRPARTVSIAMDVLVADLEGVMMPSPLTIPLASDPALLGAPWFLAGGFYGISEGGGTGEADSVDFCTVGSDGIPDVPLTEGSRRVVYRISTEADPNSPALVREVTRNLLTDQQATAEVEVLCRNVRSLKFTYFDGTDWYDDWDSTQLLSAANTPAIPMLVQIELVLNMEDWQQPGQIANTYTVTRMVQLAIAKPVDPTQVSSVLP